MFRLLLWAALIAAACWLWRRARRPARPAGKAEGATPMVRCAHCDIHLPRDHALARGERWYCSQKHLEQGAKPGDR
jgi:uncharacterized protein